MASPEAAVIAALKANAGVSALAGTRVFIWGGQQGSTYPYVAIQRITTGNSGSLDSPSNLDWPLMQIDCWSPKATEALAVAEAVRSAIDGVQITTTSPQFHAVFQDQRGPAPDDDTRNFRVSQDYHVYHERN
jgi:hypothetical protein